MSILLGRIAVLRTYMGRIGPIVQTEWRSLSVCHSSEPAHG